jgi:hypothetical protein
VEPYYLKSMPSLFSEMRFLYEKFAGWIEESLLEIH